MRLFDARDPIALWQYAERYLGVGTRTYSPYAADLDIADEYHPQHGAPSFELSTFWIPAGSGAYLRSGVPSGLHDLYTDGPGARIDDGAAGHAVDAGPTGATAAFLLPVHPNALDHPDLVGRDELLRCARGPALTVVPTANARTVFVLAANGNPVPPHFVKLHYPRRLSRFTRRLRRPVIELQLWVSDELVRIGAPVLPEVGGGWFGAGDEAWGFLIRATRPLPHAPRDGTPPAAMPGLAAAGPAATPDDPRVGRHGVPARGARADGTQAAPPAVLDGAARRAVPDGVTQPAGHPAGRPAFAVPLFALYGRDLLAPADPTLLEQLVDAWGEEPSAFVARRVVVPMVRLWAAAARATGCPLETHGQNTLFAFDAATQQTQVWYRDCAVYVDGTLRERLGLPGGLPPTNVIPRDVPMASDEVFSLTYDSFMGHHALSYVSALARDVWGVPEATLHEAARAAFTVGDLLPPTVFYYDNVLYDNGDWKLVDTGERPRWR